MTQYLIMPTKRTPHSRRDPRPPRAFSGRNGKNRRLKGNSSNPSRARSVQTVSKRADHQVTFSPTKRETARTRALNKTVASVPLQGGTFDITRRHFVIGAVGIAALAAAGVGVSTLAERMRDSSADNIEVLAVPEDAVTTSDACTEAEAESCMSLVGSFELTYGTQLWTSGDDVAACLVPGETSTPLSTVQLLWLSSGQAVTVLEQAVGQSEGFNIYDVRATSAGAIWVEADILDGTWRVYTAALSDGTLREPMLVEERSSADWETPQIAAVGSTMYWQILPQTDGSASTEASLLRAAAPGSADARTVYESIGRMATPPYAAANGVVITPRAATPSVNYQLTLIEEGTDAVLDTMVLPQSMRPLEAGYGETGFMFSFDAIYNYGDGISQLGTYVPLDNASGGDYSAASWFRYARNPTAPPCWCGRYFVVKATSSVVCIDLASNTYASLGVESGADDYGDYLASTGESGTVVTYSNIDNNPLEGEARTCCLVRVWSPL